MSSLVPITIACAEYDRTKALRDGRVRVDGCETTFIPMEPEELFFRAFRYHEFEVAELSFNSYLMTTSRGVCPYVAVPAFVSRHFRHSAVYIRTDRGIRTPADLKGKLVGMPEYQQTANVWMRGTLKEDFGIDASEIRWRIGGQEEPGRDERTPLQLKPGIEVLPIPAGETLSHMLAAGTLDAVMSARELSVFVNRAPHVGLLWPNYREVEADYYRRTGNFPIMHLVGIRKDVAAKYNWLPGSVYKAFCQAKALAVAALQEMAACKATLPWPEMAQADARAVIGADYWRYGVAECEKEIRTLARYSFEQGLAAKELAPAEIFHPSVFEISKV